MLSVLCFVSFFASVFMSDAITKETLERENRLLDSLFDPSKYDPSIRPSSPNETGPVEVHVNIYVRSISHIDDINMEYGVQLTFRQSWIDPRLKYNNTYLKRDYVTLTDLKKIWIPDIFFSNEESGHFHNIITPNVLIRITPEGKILYSTRISLKLACPMDLRNYPFDNQVCSIIFASYGYTTKDLVLSWKSGDPIQITKSLNLPKFTLKFFSVDYCNSKTNTGEYSCLKINLSFKRQFGYYLLQVYLPTIFLVLLSWVPFWLDHRATTIRVVIWVTTLLSMFILTSRMQSSLPSVSYIKAIDIWLGVCLTFLFATLIELVIVARAEMQGKNQRSQSDSSEDDAIKPSITTGKDGDFIMKFTHLRNIFGRYPSTAERIDLASRILFPVGFGLFNLIYWLSYARFLTSAKALSVQY